MFCIAKESHESATMEVMPTPEVLGVSESVFDSTKAFGPSFFAFDHR